MVKVQGLIHTTGLGTGRRTAADKARRIARLFSPSPEVASEDEEELLSPVDSVRALEEQVRTEQTGPGTSTIPDEDGSGRRTPSLGSQRTALREPGKEKDGRRERTREGDRGETVQKE